MIGLSAVVLGIAAANSARAECDGLYIALRAGGANPTIDDNSKTSNRFDIGGTDLMLSGALGYRYEYFRAEFEYIWRDTNEDKFSVVKRDDDFEQTTTNSGKGEFDYTSYMFNIYVDLSPYTWFTPYINAGVGATQLEYKFSYKNTTTGDDGETYTTGGSDSYKRTRFTWSVGGGLSAKMTNRLNLDAGYRYFDFGKLGGGQIHNHEFYGGMRYVF